MVRPIGSTKSWKTEANYWKRRYEEEKKLRKDMEKLAKNSSITDNPRKPQTSHSDDKGEAVEEEAKPKEVIKPKVATTKTNSNEVEETKEEVKAEEEGENLSDTPANSSQEALEEELESEEPEEEPSPDDYDYICPKCKEMFNKNGEEIKCPSCGEEFENA